MKIQRFSSYSLQNSITDDFINSFDSQLNESDKNFDYKDIQNKVIRDLKLNASLVLTFGAGMAALYPIVQSLMSNTSLSSFEVTPESVVMLTIAAVSITFLEEKKSKSVDEEDILTKDSKSLLEELKMRGIGNGIVKKVMKVLHSIKNIFSVISKHLGVAIGQIIDMFAYTSLLIPILNGLLSVIGKYELNFDTIIDNFIGLAMGVGTIIAKHGIMYIVSRIKNKFNLDQKEIADEIKTPVSVQRFSDFGNTNTESQGELINEQ